MLRDFQMIGRLGKIDEIQLRKQGNRGCELRIACSDFKDGEESTAWFSVVCFGKTAETALDVYSVGDLLFLSGMIDMETWTDKQSGKDRTKMKLKAFRSRRISKGKTSQEASPTNQPSEPSQQAPSTGYNQEYQPPQSKGNYYGG
jgi:single-strand DNA-binding protein